MSSRGPWVADPDGRPVHDAERALHAVRHAGVLAPLGGVGTLTGGHKGFGLAMMVQILSAALSGAGLPGGGPPDDIGHMVLAIDPAALGSAEAARQYVADLVATMHSTEPLDPSIPVLVAGEPEARHFAERRREGVPVPAALLQQLRDLCRRRDVVFLLDDPDGRDLPAGTSAGA